MGKEIIEGNKLIAEFMGYIWEEKYNGYYKPNPKWTIHSKEKAWIEKIDGKKRLKYHSSWDWQIPAFGKIALAVKTLIPRLPNPENVGRWYFRNLDKYEKAIFNNDPIEGQKIIIGLLKWYNDIPNKEIQPIVDRINKK